MVFAECEGAPSDAANESSEDIQVVFVDVDEAGRLIDEPGLKIDVKTWMALSAFARYGTI